MLNNKKVIIIGASSGIGKELALLMLKNNYQLGIASRRKHLLDEIKNKFPNRVLVKELDVNNYEEAITKLNDLIVEMGGVDIIIVNSGIGFLTDEQLLENDIKTISTNVIGFTAMIKTAFSYFKKNKSGHLVAITSIAALRGNKYCVAYNASKAFQANYLEGLRQGLSNDITITDIRPGYVLTDLTKGQKMFWAASASKAASQIYKAILKKKDIVYITKRWSIIAFLLKIIPNWLYKKIDI